MTLTTADDSPGVSTAEVAEKETEPIPPPSNEPTADQEIATPSVAECVENAFEFPSDAKKLDPGHIRAERLAYFILFGSIAVAVLCSVNFAALAIFWPPGWHTLLLISGSIVFGGLVVWLCIALPKLQYERTRWRDTPSGFEIRSGVIWRSVHLIPHDRVQHTDVTQGPIQRKFRISTLTIFTAGTSHASITLEGLSFSTACQLRDHLIGRDTEDNQQNERESQGTPNGS